jgi:hypothetical protein
VVEGDETMCHRRPADTGGGCIAFQRGIEMSIPSNIDPEAMRLIEEADWPWSELGRAFVEARDPERETTENYRSRPPARISYDELRDHGLAGTASRADREEGLR